MTDEEILQSWGAENLCRWSPEAVAGTRLAEETKRFLVEVGLPCGGDAPWRFGPDVDGLRRPDGYPTYWPVGFWNWHWALFLNEESSGVVMIVNGERNRAIFVNSGVRQLAQCLYLWHRYMERAEPLDWNGIVALLEQAAVGIAEADPVAMSETRHWWPGVIAGERMDWGAEES